VQEQNDGRFPAAGFAIEDVEVIYANGFVMNWTLSAHRGFDCGHGVVSFASPAGVIPGGNAGFISPIRRQPEGLRHQYGWYD
jgi:hypothetical protein